MEENRLAPFEGVGSKFLLRVKVDWNSQLHISTFTLVSVFKNPFSLSDVIPNASFFSDLTNDQNFFILLIYLNWDQRNRSQT